MQVVPRLREVNERFGYSFFALAVSIVVSLLLGSAVANFLPSPIPRASFWMLMTYLAPLHASAEVLIGILKASDRVVVAMIPKAVFRHVGVAALAAVSLVLSKPPTLTTVIAAYASHFL